MINSTNKKTSGYQIDISTRESIISESHDKYPFETGGILIGTIESEIIVIKYASDAGPNAVHKHSNFIRDGEYTQQYLDNIVCGSKAAGNYIGEWHSHPINCGPSQKDVKAMIWVASNAKYDIATPIMGLCIKQNSSWQLRIFILHDGKLRQLEESL